MRAQKLFPTSNRLSSEVIREQHSRLIHQDYVQNLLNALPDVAAVLNSERQIIFWNDALLKFVGLADLEDVLGKRPGEILNCVNQTLNIGGCGEAEPCRYCGAYNAIAQCLRGLGRVTKECRVIAGETGRPEFFDLSVTATSFSFQGSNHVVLTLQDISDTKRRRLLERVFFHDILNVAGGLKGFTDCLKKAADREEISECIETMDKLSSELVDEILSQRTILSAETGDLEVNITSVSAYELMNECVSYLSWLNESSVKNIYVEIESKEVNIVTDKILLKRVLINMLKNALEAGLSAHKVTFRCYVENNNICFSVSNNLYITPEVQSFIFQRSFSTKGNDRGLGTYSIKLLTELYLKGTVSFTSVSDEGTTFFVKLPN